MSHPFPVPPRTPGALRILSAAKKLFAERGFEGTTTSAIARAARTSESQIVKHFATKEGILRELLDGCWAEAMARIRRRVLRTSAREDLVAIFDVLLSCLAEDAELQTIALLDGRKSSASGGIYLPGGYRDFAGLVESLVTRLQAQAELSRTLPPQAVRAALLGMAEGLLRDRLLATRTGLPAGYSQQAMVQMISATLDGLSARPREITDQAA